MDMLCLQSYLKTIKPLKSSVSHSALMSVSILNTNSVNPAATS